MGTSASPHDVDGYSVQRGRMDLQCNDAPALSHARRSSLRRARLTQPLVAATRCASSDQGQVATPGPPSWSIAPPRGETRLRILTKEKERKNLNLLQNVSPATRPIGRRGTCADRRITTAAVLLFPVVIVVVCIVPRFARGVCGSADSQSSLDSLLSARTSYVRASSI